MDKMIKQCEYIFLDGTRCTATALTFKQQQDYEYREKIHSHLRLKSEQHYNDCGLRCEDCTDTEFDNYGYNLWLADD